MFANDPIYPSLPAADLERAKRFYAEKLGLTPESELPGGLFYRCGKDTRFSVFTSQGQASGTLYNHVNNRGEQYWIDVVNCLIRESTYVLDGLLYQDAPEIKEHYTDTGGYRVM